MVVDKRLWLCFIFKWIEETLSAKQLRVTLYMLVIIVTFETPHNNGIGDTTT